jgi:hypothetical protein
MDIVILVKVPKNHQNPENFRIMKKGNGLGGIEEGFWQIDIMRGR